MNFWKNFFNQPELWGWAVVMVALIGIIVDNTPGQLQVNGWRQGLLGQESYNGTLNDLPDESKESNGYIADTLTSFPNFSGIAVSVRSNGESVGKMALQYSLIPGIILLVLLFAGVIIITRRSNSAVYILGPLLAGLIITAIITYKVGMSSFEETDPSLGVTANIEIGGMLWSWLLWYGGVGWATMIIFRLLIKQGLVRGIDEDGPLDFSRLQEAAVHTGQRAWKIADTVGGKLNTAVGSNTLTSGTAVVTLPASVAPGSAKPTEFVHKHCTYCGNAIRGNKCTHCKNPIDNKANPSYGKCGGCGAPKTYGAEFCYNCGIYFPNDVNNNYAPIDRPVGQYCPECGEPQEPDSKFCTNCGIRLQSAVQN